MARAARHATLAVLVLLAGANCSPARHAASAPAPSALTFTIRVAGTSFDGKAWPAESISTKYRDGVLRFDFPNGPSPSSMHRATREFYLLLNLSAKTTTVVMPGRRLYWETSLDSAAARRTQRMPVVSDIDVSGRRVGSGEMVNGYVTTRYRITTRYTETPRDTSAGYARKSVQLEEDIWVANAFEGVVDPMGAYLGSLRSPSVRAESHHATDEVAERQSRVRRKLFTGMPIRTTWRYTHTFDGRWTASRASTIDLLDLKRAELSPAVFRVPDDYGRFDLKAALENAAELLLQGGIDRRGAAKDRKIP